MISRKTGILTLGVLLLFLLGGSSLSHSLQTNQVSQLRDNLIQYDYTINGTAIQFNIHLQSEIDNLVTRIYTSVLAPDFGKVKDLEFIQGTGGNWTASLAISSSTPRYISITSLSAVFQIGDNTHTSTVTAPFGTGLIDLKKGTDTRITNFQNPTFSGLTIAPQTVSSGEKINVSLVVDHPNPELFSVIASLGKSHGSVTLLSQGNGTFIGSTVITKFNYAKTNVSKIEFSWVHNFQSQMLDYFNLQNFTSPILTVTDGVTDSKAPVVDLNSLNTVFYDNAGSHYLNITVPITDASNLYDPFFQLASPNSTFVENYYMTYNTKSGLYESSILIPNNFPEFLKIIYLEAEDTDSNTISYFDSQVLANQYPDSFFFDFPIMQRPLTSQDSPDISGPTLVAVNTTASTVQYNGKLTVNLYLSDSAGFYDDTTHNNQQTVYFNTSDGRSFFITGEDQPVSENGQLKYLSYSFDLFYPAFEHNLPTSIQLWKVATVDELHNTAVYTASSDFDALVFTIQYPASWYIQSTTNSSSQSTPTNSKSSTTKSSLPYSLTGFSIILLIPILRKLSRKLPN